MPGSRPGDLCNPIKLRKEIIVKFSDAVKVTGEKKKTLKIVTIFLATGLTLFLIFLFFANISRSSQPLSRGTLDLKNWKGEQGEIIPLSGEWNFYWNRLVSYDDITKKAAVPDVTVNAPEVWNSYHIENQKLSGFGCGTYRLKVTGAVKGERLALWVPTFSTAYRLYIDGSLAAVNGNVSAQKSQGVAQYKPQMVEFTPESSEFNIIIQVSNYTYARGGMWYTLYLGTSGQIYDLEKNITKRDFFLLGGFLLMGFVFLSIWMLRKTETGNLIFAVLCFFAICRTLIYGTYFINSIFPASGIEGIVRIDYLLLTGFPGMLSLLMTNLFRNEVRAKAARLFVAYGAVSALIVLCTPISFFTQLTYFVEAADFLIMVYLVERIFVAVLHDRADASTTLASLIFVLAGVTYDILFQNNAIRGGYFEMAPVGFFIMLTLEAFVLARRFVAERQRNEEMLEALRLSTQREQNAQLKFLKSQIRPHFVHNCLNTIISVSRDDMDQARDLLIEFSNYLRGCFDFKNLDDVIPIENELELIRSYMILEQARFGDRLRVEYDIDETSLMVPPLILQPLVENAVIHGIRPKPEGGKILIYVKCHGTITRLGVMDDGCGFPKERIGRILSGTETSRGVGIDNINQRLKKLFGSSLQIHNLESGGVDVFMEIQMNGDGENDTGSLGG